MRQSSRPVGLVLIAIYQILVGIVTNLVGGCGVIFGVLSSGYSSSGAYQLILIGLLVALLGMLALISGILLFGSRRFAWRGSLAFHLGMVIISGLALIGTILQTAMIASGQSVAVGMANGMEFIIFLLLLYVLLGGLSLWSVIYLRKPNVKALFFNQSL
jgi:hypothetical protein